MDAVVDLSNVCRSADLPPVGKRFAAWSRFEILRTAWTREYGAESRLHLVADKSLRHRFPRETRRAWDRIKVGEGIIEVSYADEFMLGLAAEQGLDVLSRDQFRSLRREHPWIEAEPRRFHQWVMEGGAVRFVPVPIAPVPPFRVSQLEERDQLKAAGVERRTFEQLMRRRWRCLDLGCGQARLFDELLLWPRVHEGRAHCPSCGALLEDIGPRDNLAEVVLRAVDSGVELLRFPVEHDSPLVVGRCPGALGVQILGPESPEISRKHIVIEVRDAGAGPLLEVTALETTNGTEVVRPGVQPQKLLPDKRVRLHRGHQAILAGVVSVELSGRTFVVDPTRPDSRGSSVEASRATGMKSVDADAP